MFRLVSVALVAALALASPTKLRAAPEGEMRWALYVTIAPTWFDPGESAVGVLRRYFIVDGLRNATPCTDKSPWPLFLIGEPYVEVTTAVKVKE